MTRNTPAGQGSFPASGERRAAARGVAWGGVESATSALVGLVLTPLVVKSCGLEGLGLWSASWSLAHTTNLLDLGIGASYTRFTSRAIALSDTSGLNRTLGAGIGFHIALATLIAAGALLVGPRALGVVVPGGALASQASTVFGCTLATVVLRTVLSAYRGVVAGAQRLDRLGRIGSAASVLEGCGAAVALGAGWGVQGMAVNSLFWGGAASLAEAIAAHRLVPGLRVVPFLAGRAEWSELLSFGLRIQVVRAAEILGAHVPRLTLAFGPGLAVAGIYDLGARNAGVLQVSALPLPVIQPLAGRLAARHEESKLRALVERATRYVAILAIPGVTLVLLDAEAILRAWTGRQVPSAAAGAARLLAVALTAAYLASPLRLVLRGMGRPGIEAVAALCGSLLHVSLALVLAKPFGAPGVASAALAAATLSAALLGLGAHRAAPGLARAAAGALPAPLLAGVCGFFASAALRLALAGASATLVTRGAALERLVPETLALSATALLVVWWHGGVERQDLAAVAGAFRRERPVPDAVVPAAGSGRGRS